MPQYCNPIEGMVFVDDIYIYMLAWLTLVVEPSWWEGHKCGSVGPHHDGSLTTAERNHWCELLQCQYRKANNYARLRLKVMKFTNKGKNNERNNTTIGRVHCA